MVRSPPGRGGVADLSSFVPLPPFSVAATCHPPPALSGGGTGYICPVHLDLYTSIFISICLSYPTSNHLRFLEIFSYRWVPADYFKPPTSSILKYFRYLIVSQYSHFALEKGKVLDGGALAAGAPRRGSGTSTPKHSSATCPGHAGPTGVQAPSEPFAPAGSSGLGRSRRCGKLEVDKKLCGTRKFFLWMAFWR